MTTTYTYDERIVSDLHKEVYGCRPREGFWRHWNESTADEKQELLAFVADQRKRLADGWLDAREISSGDSEKLPALPAGATPQDAAAWTLVSRVLLNLDETVTKN